MHFNKQARRIPLAFEPDSTSQYQNSFKATAMRSLNSSFSIGTALLALTLASAAFWGCSDDGGGSSTGGFTTGGSGTGGAGGSASAGPTPREMFEALQAELLDTCESCHKAKGLADAPFLAEPDVYKSITYWPGIVVPNAAKSLLLTFPKTDIHLDKSGGTSLSADLENRVREWLVAEAKSIPNATETLPHVQPFRPLPQGAFNTLYLVDLGTDFEFISISFNAEELGGTPGNPTMLRLYNMTVHTVADKPLHIVHPLFIVYEPGQAPSVDPVDSLSNVDQTFTVEADPTLGTGEVILTNWKSGAYLGIAFNLIEVYQGQTTGSGCVDLMMFQNVMVGAMNTCINECHGGKDPQAKNTMDLSGLLLAQPDYAGACVQVRARIKPGDPTNSQILIVTDPQQQVVHKYKFLGNLSKYNEFKNTATPWINAEKQ